MKNMLQNFKFWDENTVLISQGQLVDDIVSYIIEFINFGCNLPVQRNLKKKNKYDSQIN